MKKVLSVKEAVYTPKPVETELENVETLVEHQIPVVETKVEEFKLNVLLNEEQFTEDCEKITILLEKGDFKSLFGADAKPRKGDVLSITGLAKKFKVKKSKKFSAKKKGKGYKLDLKAIAA